VAYSTVSLLLKELGWTWRIPTTFQLSKYNTWNMSRYVSYLLWIATVPDWKKLKFLDESHIVSKELHSRKVLGLRNKRTYNVATSLHESSASITILTKFGESQPIVMTYRENSNTVELGRFCDLLLFVWGSSKW